MSEKDVIASAVENSGSSSGCRDRFFGGFLFGKFEASEVPKVGWILQDL